MDFQELFNKISPQLKRKSIYFRKYSPSFDKDDLYQEMCLHLWNNFHSGVPEGINYSFIIRGCEFHILNYLRRMRQKAIQMSLDEPIDKNGNTLKDILPAQNESTGDSLEKELTINEIRNNGFTRREKDVFSLLLKGCTVREVGQQLGISHVRVVKLKKKLIQKWQRKDKFRVTK